VIPLRDLNPVQKRPLLTYLLIAINVGVYLHQATLDQAAYELFIYRYGVVPRMLAHDFHAASLTTPFTSMFMHGGWLHLILNMWFLHIFGDNVEDALGRVKFLVFYIGSGLCAAAAQVLVDPDSTVPMVGASGAIAGVLGAYFRLYPNARVVTLIPIVFFFFVRELPAVFFIVVWFLLQLLSGLGSLGTQESGGVAFFAHIGGFVAGLGLLGLLGVRRNPSAGFERSLPHGPYRRHDPWDR